MTPDEFGIVMGALVVAFLIGVVWGYKLARQVNKHGAVVEIKTDQRPRPQANIHDLADTIQKERAQTHKSRL